MLERVKTNYGLVEGTKAQTKGVIAFKGVPYAKPPVGDLRWRAPQEPDAWDGVLSCKEYKAAAMQMKAMMDFYVREFPIDYSKIEISEDCLYLNIWTPAESQNDKLPVMFYIHGGGDSTGFPHEPEHDGAYIAQHGVIYVNVTYRLNVFGFLAHPELTEESEYHASGNYGLLDQLAALKWVHENIAYFGGDPENVTIFGQSAGAGNVHAHCTSPLSKSYINKAISVSGSGVVSLMRASSLQEEEEKGIEFQKASFCASLKEMRDLPAAMVLAYAQANRIHPSFCIDNYFLYEEPSKMIIENRHLDIPYMVGSCAHEGAAFGEHYKTSKEAFRQAVNSFFCDVADIAWGIYDIQTDEDAKLSDRDVMADGASYGTHYWAKIHNIYGRRPVFVYYFCHSLPDENGKASKEAAFHSSDLWYFHGTLGRNFRKFSQEDYNLSALEMNYWTNFAKTGDPNGSDLPEWEPYTESKPGTMMLCTHPHMSNMESDIGVRTLKEEFDRI